MMAVPTSTQPAFWQMQKDKPGQCDERLLSQVWSLDLGPVQDHWNLYTTYSQEQLRYEVRTHWNAWQAYCSFASYNPWVWALKVYLWRFPLDTDFMNTLRQEMGPFWLMHVRHSDDDWKWLYSMRDTAPMNAMTLVLGLLPAHPIGEAMAVGIPPLFDGYTASSLSTNLSHRDLTLSHPALGLLDRYGNVLLHEDAHFYPRWRATLICLHSSLLDLRNGTEKKKTANSFAQTVLERGCRWLELTPRTLWKGFDNAWVEFAKSKKCLSLETWDFAVKEFSRPKNWREQLRAVHQY